MAELTDLLHRAYRPLAEQGMHYLAGHQSERETQKRIDRGTCFVCLDVPRLVGTILLVPSRKTSGVPWYKRKDVASLHQFGVDPDYQNRGVGSALLAVAESAAVDLGARELALDTAETAERLIAMYNRRGFRFVEHVRWKRPSLNSVTGRVNYGSVILSKSLSDAG